MFDSILLAADPFGHAEVALPVTCEIARKFQSEVVVLHVRESGGGVFVEGASEALAVAERYARVIKDEGISARVELREASGPRIAYEIVAAARDEGAGLVVVGSRGLSQMQALVLGSVSQQVQRLSDCPVLMVR